MEELGLVSYSCVCSLGRSYDLAEEADRPWPQVCQLIAGPCENSQGLAAVCRHHAVYDVLHSQPHGAWAPVLSADLFLERVQPPCGNEEAMLYILRLTQ